MTPPKNLHDALLNVTPVPDAKVQQQLEDQLIDQMMQDADLPAQMRLMPNAFKPTQRRRAFIPLTLLTAVFVTAVALIAILMLRRGTMTRLTAVEFLPDLQPITRDNVQGLRQVATLGNGMIYQVAWSPDGQTLALAGARGVWLYDAAMITGEAEVEPRLLPTDSEATALAYNADGTQLVSGHADGQVILWDMATRRQHRVMQGVKDRINAIAYSPDNAVIVIGAGSGDPEMTKNAVQAFDAATGEKLWVRFYEMPVMDVAVSPDNRFAAIGSGDMTELRYIESGSYYWNTKRTLGQPAAPRVTFSPDGKTLIFNEAQNLQRVVMEPGKLNTVYQDTSAGLSGHISELVYSPDGLRIAAARVEGGVTIHNAAGDNLYTLAEAGLLFVSSMNFSPDGKTLAVIDQQSVLHLYDMETRGEIGVLTDHIGNALGIAISADSKTLAVGGQGGQVRVWDLSTGTLKTTIDVGLTQVWSLAMTSDAAYIAIVGQSAQSKDAGVFLYDLTSQTSQILTIGQYSNLTFSPDGAILAGVEMTNQTPQVCYITQPLCGNPDGVGFVAKLETLSGERITSLAFSPDGAYLIGGTANGDVASWDTESGELSGRLLDVGLTRPVTKTGFAHHGRSIYMQTGEQLQVVMIAGNEETRVLLSNNGDANISLFDAAFSPDNALIVVVRTEGDWLEFLDFDAPQTPLDVPNFGKYGTVSAFFTPDSRLIVTNGFDGLIRLWGVPKSS